MMLILFVLLVVWLYYSIAFLFVLLSRSWDFDYSPNRAILIWSICSVSIVGIIGNKLGWFLWI